MTLKAQRFKDQRHALASATFLLHDTEPFASWPTRLLIRTLVSQIQRNHYVFTFDDENLVGYAGWALCSKDVAEQWLRGDRDPDPEEGQSGDCIYFQCWMAKTRRVNFFQARICRDMYPGINVYIPRIYGDDRTSRVGRVRNMVPAAASKG
jgi:hemolysin-activating ACP:hemolysin acyltransferase